MRIFVLVTGENKSKYLLEYMDLNKAQESKNMTLDRIDYLSNCIMDYIH